MLPVRVTKGLGVFSVVEHVKVFLRALLLPEELDVGDVELMVVFEVDLAVENKVTVLLDALVVEQVHRLHIAKVVFGALEDHEVEREFLVLVVEHSLVVDPEVNFELHLRDVVLKALVSVPKPRDPQLGVFTVGNNKIARGKVILDLRLNSKHYEQGQD